MNAPLKIEKFIKHHRHLFEVILYIENLSVLTVVIFLIMHVSNVQPFLNTPDTSFTAGAFRIDIGKHFRVFTVLNEIDP